jgi:hypothetical protein
MIDAHERASRDVIDHMKAMLEKHVSNANRLIFDLRARGVHVSAASAMSVKGNFIDVDVVD